MQGAPKTMHAAPGPHSASQSVSWLQSRQLPIGSRKNGVKSAQKPVLPVVSAQRQLGLLGLHETSAKQAFESGPQMPALWPTQTLVSGLPFFGFAPSQMPEQQSELSPLHGWPASRHPNW